MRSLRGDFMQLRQRGMHYGWGSGRRDRLTQTLRDAIELVDSPQELVLLLRAIGVRHLHYRVEHAHFALVGQALLATISSRAPSLDAAGCKVWNQFYAAMSTIMRGGMASAAGES